MLPIHIFFLIFVSSFFVVSLVTGLYNIYNRKRCGHPFDILFWIFEFTLLGTIVSLYFYFDGMTQIYHYKIVGLFGDVRTNLETSSQCANYVCVGNCLTAVPIGVTCIKGNMFNDNGNGHYQCITQCTQYYMKYSAAQTYVLENVDDQDKKLYLNVKTEPIYNSATEAAQVIFPLLVGKEGYLDWTTEKTMSIHMSIPWINYNEHEAEYYFGSRFTVICFGILLLIATVMYIYTYFKYYRKRNDYDVID